MGTVTVQEQTTKNPISLIGYEAGVCWGTDISDPAANIKRGLSCLAKNHGRTLEFPQVYLTLEGYSAKVIREFYTHIGGAPTRLQASTRYINYEQFQYVTPPSVVGYNTDVLYKHTMETIHHAYQQLIEHGIPKEDASMLLPLGMTTTVVVRTNLRQLIDMSRQRLCTRAFWEYRYLMKDIIQALAAYDSQWDIIMSEYMYPKCQDLGYCIEKQPCGGKI